MTICKANKGMSLEDYWWLNRGEDEYDQMGKPQLEVFNNPIKQLMKVDVKFQTVEKQKID